MVKINMTSDGALLTSLLVTLSACHVQNNSQQSNFLEKAPCLGQTVPEIDKSIWVIYQDNK
jgi:hypothetical protein